MNPSAANSSAPSATPTQISIHPPARLLFGPGPTQVHPLIYEAMAQPIVGHLDKYFFEISDQIQAMLRRVYGTKNEKTFVVSATGSGGMETAISNFVFPGTKVLIFAAGYFADRICEMATRHGADLVRVERPWGEVVSDADAAEAIRRERPEVVGYVTAETSTGAFTHGKAICDAAHEVGAVVIADCVTSLGAMPVDLDATGIDIAFSCTQKGLSCPPGLSPISVSPRAAERLKSRRQQNTSWYFDIPLITDYLMESRRYHHTAPITMFYALHQGLTLVEAEGLEQRLKRHRRAHEQVVRGFEQMGLEMYVAE
ncbi:MAG: alanine--glyoxylate aminotransferase family protein, partial [Acidobacteriaceae bacterium]